MFICNALFIIVSASSHRIVKEKGEDCTKISRIRKFYIVKRGCYLKEPMS